MKNRKIFAILIACCLFCGMLSLPVRAEGYDPGMEFNSEALLLINLDTDAVVFEKNPDRRMEPASTTKIMTYIVAYESISNLDTVITVSQEVEDDLAGTGSSLSGIYVDEKLTALQLLNLMMVPSGNDAALTLALYAGNGSEAAFVEKMNQKAKELGCENTHFVNSHGLHDDNHYTSARDLAKIARYAMNLPHFMEIVNQLYYELPPTNVYDEPRIVYSTNRMLNANVDDGRYYYRYAQGIKTGSHDQAGYCLVSTAVSGGYSYLCVALGSPSVDAEGNDISTHGEMLDSRDLYQWAFENLELKTIIKAGEVKGEVAVEYAWTQDSTLAAAAESFSAIIPSEIELSSILYKTDLPESIEAPVQKGQVLGKVTMIYADQVLGTVDLVAIENIEKSNVLKSLDVGRDILLSNWFLSVVCIVGFLVLVYILLAVLYNLRKRTSREYKNSRNQKKDTRGRRR